MLIIVEVLCECELHLMSQQVAQQSYVAAQKYSYLFVVAAHMVKEKESQIFRVITF